MNVLGLQLDAVWENKAASFARVRELLAKTPPAPGSLVVLPEMFATGFSLNTALTSQGEPQETEAFLSAIAREHRVFVTGGLVNATAGKPRNESVTFSPEGKLLARYVKIHPFSGFGESDAHEAGKEIVLFEWNGFTVAPFICYDLRFPEVFRSAVKRGANLFVVIACWPVKRQQHWLTLLQARAIENQAFVVGINRTGSEPQFTYAGRSVVVNPHGIITADAGEAEGVMQAQLDASVVKNWRKDFPALRDMHWQG